MRVGRHGQHRLYFAGFQQALGNAGGNAGPLGANSRLAQRRTQGPQMRAKVQLIGACRVAAAAMHLAF